MPVGETNESHNLMFCDQKKHSEKVDGPCGSWGQRAGGVMAWLCGGESDSADRAGSKVA
jgi:hypothetical protein